MSGLLDRLVYLSVGLAAILAFIGVKLVLEFAHEQNASVPQISTAASLVVITATLVVVTLTSVVAVRRDPRSRAHAGSLRTTRRGSDVRAANRGGNTREGAASGADDRREETVAR